MKETIVLILMALGTFFIVSASVGILRMPDVFTRISVVTKAATLGVGLTLAALSFYFESFVISTRAVAIMIFVFLTGPAAAHMIGRAAYFIGEPLWKKTVRNDLEKRYNKTTEKLASSDEQAIENQLEAEKRKEE